MALVSSMTNSTPGNPQKETGYNRHILKKDTQALKNDTQKKDTDPPENTHTFPEIMYTHILK